MHCLNRFARLGATPDIGLVGRNHQNEAGGVQFCATADHVAKELEFLEVFGRVWFPVANNGSVERAVSIKENGGAE